MGDWNNFVHFIYIAVNRDFNVLHFEIQRQVMKSDNFRAYLGIYVRLRPGWSRYVFDLSIYRLTSVSGDRQLALSKTVTVNHPTGGAWHRFDMTSVVNTWKRDSKSNHGLQVMWAMLIGQYNYLQLCDIIKLFNNYSELQTRVCFISFFAGYYMHILSILWHNMFVMFGTDFVS